MRKLHYKRKLFLILLVCYLGTSFANTKWQDSVLALLPDLPDTSRVDALNKLADSYADNDLERSRQCALSAIHLADSIHYIKGRISGRDNLGYILILKAEYGKAIPLYNEAISLAQKSNNIKKLAWLFNRLSAAYYYKGNYEEAVQSYIKTADYAKKSNNKEILLDAYNGIASIYNAKADFVNTQKYYAEALVIAQDLEDNNSIALIENNLGTMFLGRHQFNEAVLHYEKALTMYKLLKDSLPAALSLMNIGSCKSSTGNYLPALLFCNEALTIYLRKNDRLGQAYCYLNIGTIFSQKKDFVPAVSNFNKALSISTEIGSKELKKKCYDNLADIYGKMGQYKPAYTYFKMYADIKDSLFNEMNTKSMNELETKYETEKKESEISRLSLQNEAQVARSKQQTIVSYFLITGILFVIIIIFFVFRQYRITQTTNRELEGKNNSIRKQKREIEKQKLIVDTQNKEITDSINYARQIQQAILPSAEHVGKALSDYFILYKPKAIVSGDFYFFAETEDRIVLAAIDCTGHGVPGAFMSMIGNNVLTEIIIEKKLSRPDEILNQLHKGVRLVLQQDSEKSENRDGMDIALISIYKDFSNLEYAGANRPLYLIRNGALIDFKGDKFPIGGLQYEAERKFTSHTIPLQKGDAAYMFSDGYADQFGGEKGKKFMVKNLQRTLLDAQELSMQDQRNKLDTTIEAWKHGQEQIDDILVIGVRV